MFHKENHTLGNALRAMLLTNPQVLITLPIEDVIPAIWPPGSVRRLHHPPPRRGPDAPQDTDHSRLPRTDCPQVSLLPHAYFFQFLVFFPPPASCLQPLAFVPCLLPPATYPSPPAALPNLDHSRKALVDLRALTALTKEKFEEEEKRFVAESS